MVYRYSWLAGIAAIALAAWEMSFLLRDSSMGTPWQVAVFVAVLLGAGITWTSLAYHAHAVIVIGANVAAFVVMAGLLIAPDTLWVIFPTVDTWDALIQSTDRAFEIIRYGVEPVVPLPGLVLLLVMLFWTLGFLLISGLLNGRPFVAVLTPLIVALQFVIIDRRPKSITHLALFVIVVAGSLLSIRIDERDSGSGRLHRVNATTRPAKRPSPSIGLLLVGTIVIALGTVGFAGSWVPNNGFMTWRTPGGYSDDYSGSVTYNPYTDISAGLLRQTNTPLFRARVDGVDPGTVRYRTVTLDVYSSGRWMTDRVRVSALDDEPRDNPIHDYRGETVPIRTSIVIDNLRSPWLPAPSTVKRATTTDEDDLGDLRSRDIDGSLMIPGGLTYEGMEYLVASDIPRYDGPTIAALALTDSGELSPLFALASESGEDLPDAVDLPPPVELPNEEFWTEWPSDEVGPELAVLAYQKVGNVTTNFEKALALEHWFRDSGEFTYEDGVPPGFATDDVYAWLTDEDNPYSRSGYCEQFATAMALMARSIGVPSRVVLGFTPGTQLTEDAVQVYDKNAHSWVEMWIPRFGWMEFDPTPRSLYSAATANSSLQDALGFSPAAYIDDIPDPAGSSFDGEIEGVDGRFTPADPREGLFAPAGGGGLNDTSWIDLPSWAPLFLVVILVVSVILVIAPTVHWIRRRRRIRRLAGGDIAAAWNDIVEQLVRLGEPIDPSSTPIEVAEQVDRAIVPLAKVHGETLYGGRAVSTTVIERATDAHLRAEMHLDARYTTAERARAVYRPMNLVSRWNRVRARLASREQ